MARAGSFPCLTVAVFLAIPALPAHARIPTRVESAFRQDSASTQGEPVSGELEFPISQIPTQSEATATRLREIEQALRPTRELVLIESGLPGARDTVTAIWNLQREILEKQRSRRLVFDLNQEWARREGQYTAWRNTVQTETATLAQLAGEVDSVEKRWLRTESAAAPDLPLQITGQIRDALTALQATAAEINKRLDELLATQNGITKILLDIEQARAEITTQLGEERRELLLSDSPPLWKAAAYSGIGDVGPQLARALRSTWLALGYFAAVYRSRLNPHIAVTIVLIGLALVSRRKSGFKRDSQAGQGSQLVATHPVASILLTSLLATWWIYPRALLPVYDLAMLLIAVPLLILIPAYVRPEGRRPAFALVGFGVFLRLSLLLLGEAPAQRLVLLLLAILGAAWIYRVLRHGGLFGSRPAGTENSALQTVLRLAFVGLIASVLANIVGNFSLATLLTMAILTSGYFALVLAALVHVFTEVFVLLLSLKATERSLFVQHHRLKLSTSGSALVRILAILVWIVMALRMFALYDPVAEAARSFFGAKLTVGLASVSVGGVLLFLLTVWLSVVAGRALSSLLELDLFNRMDLPYGVPNTIGKMVRYTLIALGFFFALAAIGVELSKLTILGGALGVGVGFGLQNIVNNFVSGLILAFERPIREGDVIEVGGLLGTVRHIGARASTLRTYDGAEVVVPNADLIAKQVVNWTLSDRSRRVIISLGVAYGSEPREVMAILVETALQHPKVLKVPEPGVTFKGFGESSLDFDLLIWAAEFEEAAGIKGEVGVAVYEALRKAGIEIPFPQRDLHLRSADVGAAETLRR